MKPKHTTDPKNEVIHGNLLMRRTCANTYAIIGCEAMCCQSVTIPTKVRGVPVTDIESGAFRNCAGLESIKISASVRHIGIKAFKGCKGLREIVFREGLIEIEDYAFADCVRLESIHFPASVRQIGRAVLEGCNNLRTIFVDPKNKYYRGVGNCLIEIRSRELIAGCQNAVIPSDGSVKSIAPYAFAGQSGLVQITIPAGIHTIGAMAFADCRQLLVVRLNKGLKVIETAAFSGCASLVMLNLPDGLTTIGEEAFAECSSLECVVGTYTLTRIEANAFWACNQLTRMIG